MGDREDIYLSFRFIPCELARLPAERYIDSGNIVARLNLPNMQYPREQRVEVYAYADYIDNTGDNTMGLVATLLEKGRQEGLQKGEAAMLLRLLALKFGPLPETITEKVCRADADTLLAWSERVLTAATAEQVVKE